MLLIESRYNTTGEPFRQPRAPEEPWIAPSSAISEADVDDYEEDEEDEDVRTEKTKKKKKQQRPHVPGDNYVGPHSLTCIKKHLLSSPF